jgi:LysM repeat protein
MRLPSLRPTGPIGLLVSNELAKALIINTETGESHEVMYNPEELKLDQGNTFAEVGIPGLNSPPVQYVRGKARTLSMELFFDTYETRVDVRDFTGPVVRLLDKLTQTQAPPILLFSLGRFQFQCVLVSAAQRFTMFLRDGTPVRSTLSVQLQEYVRIDVQVTQGLFIGSPTVSAAVNAAVAAVRAAAGGTAGATAVHVVAAGDTLSGLAAAYLGDPALWRDIARANSIIDPLGIAVGQTLVIPGKGRS